ncbi:MAG: SDR family NAD(P)-dependent oxidoreductase, partial [Enterobacter roggenkampii]
MQNNTSTLGGQRFSSVFSGEEFFLAEHQIMGNRVMPGAAWLEMAIAALTASVAGDALANIVLKNVVWSRPLIVNEPGQQVHISVSRTDGQALVYRIYGDATDPSEEATVYGQGGATLSVEATTAAPSRIDIQQVRATCTKSTLSGEACYAQLRAAGMEYGNGHKGIVQLDIGETMLLAKLVLPDALRAGADAYSLHPAILDSALQATAFLTFAQDGTPVALAPSLPFALGELRLNGDCETTMWAVVVSRVSDTGFRTFDIDLCRENGDLCAALRGVATRQLANESDIAAQTTDNMMMAPCWTARDIGREEPLQQYETHCVLLCDATSIRPEEIERVMPGAICLVPEVAWENALGIAEIARRYQQTTIFLFNEIQRRIRAREKGRILIQVLLPSGEKGDIFAGVAALLKTARLENPRIWGQVIAPGQEDSGEPTRLLELLKMNAAVPYDGEIRYAAGQRYIRDWEEVVSPPQDDGRQTLSGGAWLITGGAGGLGMIFARYLTRQSGERRIILTGRRTLNDEQRQAIAALGNRVVYRQCDIADSGQVAALTDFIQSDYGELEGILHTAGVIKDNYLINKTEQEFAEVMAPKVAGVANLDAMTERLPPALFILFSSGVSLFGNAGQADYAAANGFMDAFAQYRNHLQARGERRGKTLSVNWPLWAEGGMHIDAEVQKIMEKNTGMTPMKTATGVNALFRATSVSASQIMVLEGDLLRIRRQIASSRVQESPALLPVGQPDKTANVAGESTVEALTQAAIAYLKKLLSGALKLPADQIDDEVMLEEYGIDSIMVTQLTERLEKDFGSLSKTLFFEYRSLAELAGYFVDTHREKLHEHADIATFSVPSRQLNAAPAPVVEAIASVTPAAPLPSPPATDVEHSVAQDIAIIGVQGRYPQADDPQTFWDNLTQGRDCISEIPIERWDHSRYFDASKDAPGKSYSKWGGFINDVDKFDPLFFNISPAEAEYIDPQERLFLQTVWHTLEDAGYRPGAFSGLKVGVYVGVMWGQYQVLEYQMLEQNPEARILVPSFSYASIANRISYVFNFKGPSIALDTMCSSSLTAIHLAAEGIRHKACDVAIAGGVNINVHPGKYAQLSYGRFASSDGRCRSFGADGDGYVPGEGVGAILLKPLMQAEQDGDQIYGVIRASAINHGGKTNGYTVPNPNAQAELIQEVFAKAELDPATISYVEAHGTGTALGDPIEIRGLAKAFGTREGYPPCAIGSVKSNIGHLESAAGIAAVTKVLLQFKHRALVPSLHAQDLNPNIDFSAVPFRVQRALAHWERPAIVENGVRKTFPRRAGVSAFGAGGSNAHVILEEYVAAEGRGAGGQNEGPYLILLSARDEERLREYAARLLAFITREGNAGETPSPSLMQELTRIFAGLLHVDRALIDIDAGLGEYDIEPLLLAEFCHQINQKYACRLL